MRLLATRTIIVNGNASGGSVKKSRRYGYLMQSTEDPEDCYGDDNDGRLSVKYNKFTD